jgi:hypothetical protein
MTRIERFSALNTLPADVPLTPGTLDQVKAISEGVSELWICYLRTDEETSQPE